MEFSTDTSRISIESIKELFEANKVALVGNHSPEKLYSAIANSFLVVSVWNGSKLVGLCRLVSDGIYFGRIQELIIHPEIQGEGDIVTDILQLVFKSCPTLNSFHLNPGVYQKKEIYHHKHFSSTPQLRKLYWSIHEDEF